MRSLVLDTNAQVKELEQSGFSRAQAEGFTRALNNLDTSGLATRSDLDETARDLKLYLEKALHRQTWALVGLMFAQTAFIITVLHYLG